MIIKQQSKNILLKLLEETKLSLESINNEIVEELNASGLVRINLPYVELTYSGEELANVLKDINTNKERIIGSEIIAMIEMALKNNDKTTSITNEELEARGFAKDSKLTEAAKEVFEIYKNTKPELTIDAKLANYIRKSPMGPTESSHMPQGNKDLLEAMRIISYSVPVGEYVTFTHLGRAIKETLNYGGFVDEGSVLDNSILENIAKIADGEDIDIESLVMLEELGYIIDIHTLNEAGERALEVYRILHDNISKDIKTFAIEKEEIKLLKAIDALEENATFDEIKKYLISEKSKEMKTLIDKYGDKIGDLSTSKAKLVKDFINTKDETKWFENNFDLREYLHSLEAFKLVEEVEDVYKLTPNGKKVLKDQADERAIHSWSIKALYSATSINRKWVEEARKERILGVYEPTKSAYLYEELAQSEKLPFISKYEAEIFRTIPSSGVSCEELLANKTEEEKHKIIEAIDKLEAKGFIQHLADGHIIETEAGKLMDEAISAVPSGFGEPVTPAIYKVVKAIAEVGSLYEKEKKIRIQPKKLKEAQKLSGLSADKFDKMLLVAKEANFIGHNSVNKAGLDLLQAVEILNK